MARPRVALVIPTLNEEEAIGGVIAAVPLGAADEIIVVDSGSADRTVERARAADARVVSLRERGYGRACRAGAEAAEDCDIVAGQFLESCLSGTFKPVLFNFSAPPPQERIDHVVGIAVRAFMKAYGKSS